MEPPTPKLIPVMRTWERLRDLGSCRTGQTIMQNGHILYLFGGTDGLGRTCDMFKYDTVSQVCTSVDVQGALPAPRSGAVAVVLDNRAYLFGGHNGRNKNYYNALWSFDFETELWELVEVEGNVSPRGRVDHAMVLHNTQIYVYGGQNSGCRFGDMWRFDIAKSQWYEEKKMAGTAPCPRFGHTGVVQHRIRAPGGGGSDNQQQEEEAQQQQQQQEQGGQERDVEDCMIVFGGWNGRATLRDVWAYSFNRRQWREVVCTGTAPESRYRHSSVVKDGVMYTFGGVAADQTRFNDVHALNLGHGSTTTTTTTTTGVWEKVSPRGVCLPLPRTFQCAVTVGDAMLILGGIHGTTRLGDVYRLDLGPLSPPSLQQLCGAMVRSHLASSNSQHPPPLRAGGKPDENPPPTSSKPPLSDDGHTASSPARQHPRTAAQRGWDYLATAEEEGHNDGDDDVGTTTSGSEQAPPDVQLFGSVSRAHTLEGPEEGVPIDLLEDYVFARDSVGRLRGVCAHCPHTLACTGFTARSNILPSTPLPVSTTAASPVSVSWGGGGDDGDGGGDDDGGVCMCSHGAEDHELVNEAGF